MVTSLVRATPATGAVPNEITLPAKVLWMSIASSAG